MSSMRELGGLELQKIQQGLVTHFPRATVNTAVL